MIIVPITVGKNPLKEMEEPSEKTKESEMQSLDAISKTTEWSLFVSKVKFNITVIQVYVPTSHTEEAEVERFYEDLQDLLELTPQKDVLFIIGDGNAKVGSQETPGVQANLALECGLEQGKDW